jgi:hypothetical protein
VKGRQLNSGLPICCLERKIRREVADIQSTPARDEPKPSEGQNHEGHVRHFRHDLAEDRRRLAHREQQSTHEGPVDHHQQKNPFPELSQGKLSSHAPNYAIQEVVGEHPRCVPEPTFSVLTAGPRAQLSTSPDYPDRFLMFT